MDVPGGVADGADALDLALVLGGLRGGLGSLIGAGLFSQTGVHGQPSLGFASATAPQGPASLPP